MLAWAVRKKSVLPSPRSLGIIEIMHNSSKLDKSAVVSFEAVDFSYGSKQVLSNIDLKLPRGKITAIFGGSGTGKTTVLRMIGGQLNPDRGLVAFEGREIKKMSFRDLYDARRKMGMLFQFGALFTDLSVYENVAFPLREHTDLSDALINDLVTVKLNSVGLRGTKQLNTSELSGGMARRVALARAIALDPDLMLYDEPFTGLDPIATSVIANLIRKLNYALGLSSVLVTHDVEVSLGIVDYCLVMSNGKLVGQGTPDEIKRSNDPIIKQFISGEIDGPVPLHYPAPPYNEDLGLIK